MPAREGGTSLEARTSEAARLKNIIDSVSVELKDDDRQRALQRYRHLVERDAPDSLRKLLPSGWSTRGGAGKGKPALVPWVSAFPPAAEATPLRGYYLSLLFCADGSGLYVCLQQNAEGPPLSDLRDRVSLVRQLVGPISGLSDDLDLKTTSALPRRYEAAAIYSCRFSKNTSPSELAKAIDSVVDVIEQLRRKNFEFEPTQHVSAPSPVRQRRVSRPPIPSRTPAAAQPIPTDYAQITARLAPKHALPMPKAISTRGTGIYVIYGDPQVWKIISTAIPAAVVRQDAPIYVGTAAQMPIGRRLDQHVGLTRQNNSAFRVNVIATFSAVYSWPVRTVWSGPNPFGIPDRDNDYRLLHQETEDWLSSWMAQHMTAAVLELPGWIRADLKDLEKFLVRSQWDPPLNHEHKLATNLQLIQLEALKRPLRQEAKVRRAKSEQAGSLADIDLPAGNEAWVLRQKSSTR